MGDRCYLNMCFRLEDLPDLCTVLDYQPSPSSNEQILGYLFDGWESDGQGIIEAFCYEANYGWYTERHQLALLGVPFFGHHAEGGEYSSATFAAINGEIEDIPAFDGIPQVPINRDRAYDSDTEASAIRYWELYDQVHLLFYGEPVVKVLPKVIRSTRLIRV